MKFFSITLASAILFSATFSRASFEENAHRYLSGQQILWSLSMFFDFTKNSGKTNLCTAIQSLNATLSGANSPATGEPISPAPTQATVLWITGCVENYLSNTANIATDSGRLANLVGPEMLTYLGDHPQQLLDQPWSQVPADVQSALIVHMVSAFLGSDDVIQDFGFIADPEDYRHHLAAAIAQQHDASAIRIVTLLALNLSVRDEFLSY